ncbi:MAG TPA: hypothetical protein VGA70_00075 [Longimicrobiales bacterium]
MKPLAQAVGLAVLWGGLLILLAVLWVQSPFTGSASMFLGWTLPGAALLAGTWFWLEARKIRNVPRGRWPMGTVAAAWILTAWVVLAGVGPELALDGLILRDPARRALGTVLRWLPVVFAAALSTAGLAATLEARYRIVHAEAGAPGPPSP